MRSAICVLLAATAPALAQPPAPNTLTPDQAREGWILLFDGETDLGWKTKGDIAVRDGAIVCAGDPKGPLTGLTWRGYPPPAHVLKAEVRGLPHYQQGRKGEGTGFRMYSFRIGEFGDVWTEFSPTDPKQRIQKILAEDNDGLAPKIASIGFGPGEESAAFRSIKLLPKNMTSLFNGKDLAGWKIFDGKKSKFDVKDGLLSIENGPGDLQTEAKYKNFLLQLECRTNGKHLNSGVFFRCRAGEYQNGYEAQINNNFLPSPKDYVVEEYDLKTHKLLGKKTVKSNATDFGTGSIYRRIPATKDIAKDGEWFTMTVLAHGNHFATWVNGIQTIDWYDNRPPNDNARNGYRSEAGHISLQGHDPTTNLSFRNIRIAELPD
jgi:hypothetical protein